MLLFLVSSLNPYPTKYYMKSLLTAMNEQASLEKSLASISRRAAVIGEVFGKSRKDNFLKATEAARRAGLSTVYCVDLGNGFEWTATVPGGVDSTYCNDTFSF